MTAHEDISERFDTPIDTHFYGPIARVLASASGEWAGPSAVLGVVGLGSVVGVAGASLLRYPSARQLVPGALLLVGYGVLDATAAALAKDQMESARGARTIGALVVGLACAVGAALHLALEDGASGAALAIVALIAVMLQGALADAARRRATRRRAKDDEGLFARLFARLFPQLPAGTALDLGALPRAWGFLSNGVHVLLFAVFVCADAIGVYAWLRLIAGTILALGLLFEQRRRVVALLPPPAPQVETPTAAGSAAPPPPAPNEPPHEERRSVAPISFRPPPDE